MSSTSFSSGTVIASPWLNDVNKVAYSKTFPDGTVAVTAAPGSSLDATNVSYEQGSTGYVSTTVAAKLKQVVSVKDFGAKGDGVTDDTAAIQTAINALNPYVYGSSMNYAQGGGTLYFPSGNYFVTSTIRLPNNVILSGAGCQTYQTNTTPTAPAQGTSIFVNSSFTGSFVIDTAGYTSAGTRYSSAAAPTSTLTYTEGCGIDNIGFINNGSSALAGVRACYAPVSKWRNVSCYNFPTGFVVNSVWNAEFDNLFSWSTKISLAISACNASQFSGQFDSFVVNGVGNGVTSSTTPPWWNSIDTVYGSTSIYITNSNGIEFESVSTQHAVRAFYVSQSTVNLDSWYAEDFTLSNPAATGYITGAALVNADNGSKSTTPLLSTSSSTITINSLFSQSNGVTVFDSIYNSNVTMLGMGQPPGSAGVGILYGPNTSTGQQILLGKGVLRNGNYPDIAYDSRQIYLAPTYSTVNAASLLTNIGGTISSATYYIVQTGDLFNVTLVIKGTTLTSTNGIASLPFNGTNGYPSIKYDVAGAQVAVSTAGGYQTGSAYVDYANANMYLTNVSSATEIVVSFSVAGN
jgi:hypothetical protein